ncbi:asparagine synthase (glutamine-hydrolyzing) [Mangrovicella endophytica]|uniref:asparagine synthase (glutamine-hydrolyzing) n=1 Tax=Mangrovicella endophytica TaxID=2066697 RepID=UPI000C9E6CB5|nr:asparagine synthase (glutamine-hydrolyzing) [Mangrovicella endophytica]
MCGIAGLIDLGAAPADMAPLLTALRHRGPDAQAFVRVGSLTLGATRLAVVGAAGGAQPMQDEPSGITLVFNGEIYNAPALRQQLAEQGHRFRSTCDTEVVLRAWVEWGPGTLDRLSGMFALAIAERDGRRLVLARDPAGIKPLLVARLPDGRGLVFASEIGALLAHPAVSAELDLTAFADLISVGHPLGAASLFAGVDVLPAGHILEISWQGRLLIGTPRPFRRPYDCDVAPIDAEDAVETALEAAIRSHLQADEPVAVALSGGLDSSLIAALAAESISSTAYRLRSYTVAASPEHPDARAAAAVAAAIGTEHHLLTPSFDDYLAAVPETIAATRSPDLGAGPMFLLLCRRIAADTKACLNGEGADEMFGGYPSHVAALPTLASMEDGLRRARRSGLQPSDAALALIERVRRTASSGVEHFATMLAVNRADQLERCHLDPVDQLSMAASLEMRVPYLEGSLRALVTALPTSLHHPTAPAGQKPLLRRIARRRFGSRLAAATGRAKLMMPDAAGDHAVTFATMCERALARTPWRHSALGVCFPTAKDFVTFELFRRICIEGQGRRSDLPSIRDLLAELSGRRRRALA